MTVDFPNQGCPALSATGRALGEWIDYVIQLELYSAPHINR